MKIKWLNTLFLDMEGRERERFFEESLKRLQSASAGGFEKLRNRCEIELQLYSSNYSTVNVTARADKSMVSKSIHTHYPYCHLSMLCMSLLLPKVMETAFIGNDLKQKCNL